MDLFLPESPEKHDDGWNMGDYPAIVIHIASWSKQIQSEDRKIFGTIGCQVTKGGDGFTEILKEKKHYK